MEITPIGVIRTPHRSKDECPIQPPAAKGARGRVEVAGEFAEGLKDVDMFSHVYLLYSFDRAGEIKLTRPTFLDDRPHGVFACRHPCRPNGIGLSIVKVVRREGNVLVVEGVDMLDETPLLDIKPYVPKFDDIEGASGGWTDTVSWRSKPEGRE